MLEYRYVRLVERPHRLPSATRQAKITEGKRHRYLDNLYDNYGLCVELDGLQAHPDDQRWQDLRRVNAITQQGLTMLRYGWTDVNSTPCQTAAQIAAVLTTLGWTGKARPCGPRCPAGSGH
jgi:very-short-patch-repair endonuclease